MTSAQLAPAIVLPLIAWRVYIRIRRNIGRQPLQLRSLKRRIAIWSIILVVFAAFAVLHPLALAALAAGVVLSVGLAWLGIRYTSIESTPQGDFYTPNTIIGVGLSLLVVGRLAYRMTVIMAGTAVATGRPPSMFDSPLTLGMFGLMAGYYVAYYIAVVVRTKHLHPAIK